MARALYGPTSALADLSDRMTRTCPYVLYRLTCAFDRGSSPRTYVLHRRACTRAYVFDSLAGALDRRAGAGAYVSHSRSRALADLTNGVARSLSYVCYR